MWWRRLVPIIANEAVRGAAEAAQSSQAATDDLLRPLDQMLIYALDLEAAPRIAKLENPVKLQGDGFRCWISRAPDRRLGVCVTGTGSAAAGAAAAAAIAAHQPHWVISVGLAGALEPSVSRGDLLLVRTVKSTESPDLQVGLKLSEESLEGSPGVRLGDLFTAERLVAAPDDKAQLFSQSGAAAVDMETYAVAAACQQAGVRFMGVRIISDDASEEIPPEVAELLKRRSTAGQAGAAAAALMRRPSVVKDLYRLRETAIELSDQLDEFLDGVLEQLT